MGQLQRIAAHESGEEFRDLGGEVVAECSEETVDVVDRAVIRHFLTHVGGDALHEFADDAFIS